MDGSSTRAPGDICLRERLPGGGWLLTQPLSLKEVGEDKHVSTPTAAPASSSIHHIRFISESAASDAVEFGFGFGF